MQREIRISEATVSEQQQKIENIIDLDHNLEDYKFDTFCQSCDRKYSK